MSNRNTEPFLFWEVQRKNEDLHSFLSLGWIIFSKVTYLIILYKDRYRKKIRSIGGSLGVLQAIQNIRPKYKGNGHKIGHTYILAITFYGMHLSIWFFDRWSIFWPIFPKTPHLTIFMTIYDQAVMVIMAIFLQLVIMAPFHMVIEMAI